MRGTLFAPPLMPGMLQPHFPESHKTASPACGCRHAPGQATGAPPQGQDTTPPVPPHRTAKRMRLHVPTHAAACANAAACDGQRGGMRFPPYPVAGGHEVVSRVGHT